MTFHLKKEQQKHPQGSETLKELDSFPYVSAVQKEQELAECSTNNEHAEQINRSRKRMDTYYTADTWLGPLDIVNTR